jgi:probable HAF family extracellular repeat protein
MRFLKLCAIFCAALLAACEPSGVIDDLGTLGGPRSVGLGINKAGNVVGSAWGPNGFPATGLHAYRWVDGLGMIDVGALPGGDISEAQGISDSGLVVGGSFVQGSDFVPNAFIATANLALTNIGRVDAFSFAWDVNDAGQVTGEAETNPKRADIHAFIWTRAGGMQDLGTLGGSDSVGRAINASGQVAGESDTANDASTRAFRFTPGAGMVNLGTLGGTNSSAFGINDSGQVVGEADTGFPGNTTSFQFKGVLELFGTHAFLWTEGQGMIDLGHLGGNRSTAHAINNRGIVVGVSKIANGEFRAFRWTHKSGMVDMNGLLPRNSGWVLLEAWDVNDKGQIAGTGRLNGELRAFRYNPPPEPVLQP